MVLAEALALCEDGWLGAPSEQGWALEPDPVTGTKVWLRTDGSCAGVAPNSPEVVNLPALLVVGGVVVCLALTMGAFAQWLTTGLFAGQGLNARQAAQARELAQTFGQIVGFIFGASGARFAIARPSLFLRPPRPKPLRDVTGNALPLVAQRALLATATATVKAPGGGGPASQALFERVAGLRTRVEALGQTRGPAQVTGPA